MSTGTQTILSLDLYTFLSAPTNLSPGPDGKQWIQERIWQPLEHCGRPHWFQVLGRQCPIPSTFLVEGGGTDLSLVGNSTHRLATLQTAAGDSLLLHAVFQDPVFGATSDGVPCSDVEAAARLLLERLQLLMLARSWLVGICMSHLVVAGRTSQAVFDAALGFRCRAGARWPRRTYSSKQQDSWLSC